MQSELKFFGIGQLWNNKLTNGNISTVLAYVEYKEVIASLACRFLSMYAPICLLVPVIMIEKCTRIEPSLWIIPTPEQMLPLKVFCNLLRPTTVHSPLLEAVASFSFRQLYLMKYTLDRTIFLVFPISHAPLFINQQALIEYFAVISWRQPWVLTLNFQGFHFPPF